MTVAQTVSSIILGLLGIALSVGMTFFIEPPQFWRSFRTRQTFKNHPLFWTGILMATGMVIGIRLVDYFGLHEDSQHLVTFIVDFSLISAFLYFYRVWIGNVPENPNLTLAWNVEARLLKRALAREPAKGQELLATYYKNGLISESTYNLGFSLLEPEEDP